MELMTKRNSNSFGKDFRHIFMQAKSVCIFMHEKKIEIWDGKRKQ